MGGYQPVLRREMNVETYLVDHVHKFLGILSREMFDRLSLVIVREDGRYQIVELMRREGIVDQPFPGWRDTTHENTVKLMNG
jgi:hypothetical protein